MQCRSNEVKPLPSIADADAAQALQTLRKRCGLSQEQLAEESGYHRTYISQLERGLKSPSLRTLGNLARALGLSTSTLVQTMEEQAKRRLARQTKTGERAK